MLHTVWRCPRSGDEQCTFFLWMEHEAGVQEQLKFAQPPPFPQTPIQRGASSNKPDQPAVSAHEIGLALDVGETKLRRYEETIQNFVGGLRNLRQPFRSLQHRMRYLRWNETFSVTLPIENCSAADFRVLTMAGFHLFFPAKSPAPCPPLFNDLNTKPWPTLVQITTCKRRFAGFYEFQTSCHISLTTFHGVGRLPASACHRQCIGIILIRQ